MRFRKTRRPIYELISFLLMCAPIGACAGDAISSSLGVRSIATMDLPAYLQPAIDPAFGTAFVRVTNPEQAQSSALACIAEYCRHRYSSSQAWNADQSLLLIRHGCGGYCFLDGRTYESMFSRRNRGECEWSPRDPELMICVGEGKIYTWAPRPDTRNEIARFAEFAKVSFGLSKGNPSRDGSRIVVVGTDQAGELTAFAYDINKRKRYASINLPTAHGRTTSCSISASGKFIYCGRNIAGRLQGFIYTLDGEQVQHWTEHHRPGHGDFALDSDGSDIFVGVSKDGPDRLRVIKRRLSDGAVTVLSGRGHAQHVSARNVDLQGWVFVSYSGSPGEMRRAAFDPFYQEIVALRTDGSGKARRITQTRSVRHNYRSEAQGSPSPDGSRVIWASNWGVAGGSVASYVSLIEWP